MHLFEAERVCSVALITECLSRYRRDCQLPYVVKPHLQNSLAESQFEVHLAIR